MYAKNGYFYVDVDNRHWFVHLLLLGVVEFLILVIRYLISSWTKSLFDEERQAMFDFFYSIPSRFKKKKED